MLMNIEVFSFYHLGMCVCNVCPWSPREAYVSALQYFYSSGKQRIQQNGQVNAKQPCEQGLHGLQHAP